MIGIISDAHGNIFALKKALSFLNKMNVQEIVFLGDAVGYIPLGETINMLRAHPLVTTVLAGNHEKMLTAAKWGDNDNVYQLSVTKAALPSGDIKYLEQLPSGVKRDDILFVHGSPDDPVYGYLHPDTDLMETAERFVFCGHTHRPFVRKVGRTTYVNVGSCGLPRDDGRYGAFAVFDGEKADILRFSIEQETQLSLDACARPVHEAVRQVFKRRADTLIGTLHG